MVLPSPGAPVLVAGFRMHESKQKPVSLAAVAHYVQVNWKPVTTVLIGGLLAGMGFGALQSERTIKSYAASSPAAVAVQAAKPLAHAHGSAIASELRQSGVNSSEEVARLQSRNRRLEALVAILRDRRRSD